MKRESQVTMIESPLLAGIPRVTHGFSTRRAEHDRFSLGPVRTTNPEILNNRIRFLALLGLAGWPVARLKQVHSNIVCVIENTLDTNEPMEGDASMTAAPGIVLAVQTADCLPILIADRQSRAIATVHSGWRGTLAGIAGKAVRKLTERYGIEAAELCVAIGPHVGVCCYEVGDEVFRQFDDPDVFECHRERPKPHLDLAAANRKQLLAAGISDQNIQASSLCTACRPDLFFSYRRDGDRAGRMLSVIGIVPYDCGSEAL